MRRRRSTSGGHGIRAALALVAGLLATPAHAELVVLVGGSILKVDSYRLEGKRARLVLPSGGRLTLPIGRVERVVDDEVLPPEELGEAVERGDVDGSILGFAEAAPVPDTPYGELIWETARRHSVNPALVAAMVRAESAFDPQAVSSKGARGLLQLMPATASRFGVPRSRLFEPRANLEAGVKYLRWLVDRYPGDLPRVLAAYNAGEANVDRYDGVPPFRETRGYIRRIYRGLGLSSAGAS